LTLVPKQEEQSAPVETEVAPQAPALEAPEAPKTSKKNFATGVLLIGLTLASVVIFKRKIF